MLKIGDINDLKVLRETDIGFMLDSKDEEVFLHKNESNFLKLKKGDKVSAFLYFDQKGRLAATLKTPYITASEPGFLEVRDLVYDLGVFLDLGISKDLLLSKDDLPYDNDEKPAVGDKLFVRINIKGKLVAKLIDPNDIIGNDELEIGEEKDFYVQRIGKQGLNLVNEELNKVFVHSTMFRGKYRLGEKVNVKIISKTEKGFNGSLVKQKEHLRIDDSEVIMEYLNTYKTLPLNSKSSSEDVEKYFDMSKKAFKRALGLLYKERKIEFTENETKLVSGDKE